MFTFASGCVVQKANEIQEGYKLVTDGYLCANISFERLFLFLRQFYCMLEEPLFFILQLPMNSNKEEEIRKSENDPFHEEVYYLDGCTREFIDDLFEKHGELLLNDGMCQFGVASHETGDEIFFEKYKIATIFSKNMEKFFPLFEKYNIPKVEELKTAWDTFSPEAPGMVRTITVGGMSCYDLVEELKKSGLYFAELRDEK